jgi:hypothetical protein
MPSSTSDRGRRNVMLALAHGAIALGILALFFWVQAHR